MYMNFTKSIQTCYKKFFDFSGRASKSEFWWFQLYSIIIYGLMFVFQGDLVIVLSVLAKYLLNKFIAFAYASSVGLNF